MILLYETESYQASADLFFSVAQQKACPDKAATSLQGPAAPTPNLGQGSTWLIEKAMS